MARIRTVKPEFWKHEDLSSLPPETHMLAAALLNYADDEGYFNANPALVKAECAPLRNDVTQVEEMLSQLAAIDYVRFGTGERGRRYGHVVNFSTHQQVNKKKASKIKDLEITWDESGTATGKLPDESRKATGGNREQGREVEQGREQGVPSEPVGQEPDVVAVVFDHWRKTHNHPRAQLDAKRRKLIRDALKTYSEADLCEAITGYLNSPHHMGDNDRDTVFDSIELLLKDAKHVDMGLKFAREPPRKNLSKLTRRNVAATEGWKPPELRSANN